MSALDNVLRNVTDEIAPLKEKRRQHVEAIAAIDLVLEPLEETERLLKGKAKKKTNAARKAGKPCARKRDVMDICLALVEANQPIAKADLVSLAKHKILENGQFSQSGISLRLSECLRSDVFLISDDHTITLASDAAKKGAA